MIPQAIAVDCFPVSVQAIPVVCAPSWVPFLVSVQAIPVVCAPLFGAERSRYEPCARNGSWSAQSTNQLERPKYEPCARNGSWSAQIEFPVNAICLNCWVQHGTLRSPRIWVTLRSYVEVFGFGALDKAHICALEN